MKLHQAVSVCLAIAVLPVAALAQTAPPNPGQWGPTAGLREFTLGGSGGSNKDMDDSFGGVNGSFGQYLNDALLLSLRQTINYANPNTGGRMWNGATRIALDQHLSAIGRARPFVGLNLGRVYGDGVDDTWSGGLEAGAKFYVQPRTFVYAMAEYGWFFDRAKRIDDRFSSGQYLWGVGIGFNF